MKEVYEDRFADSLVYGPLAHPRTLGLLWDIEDIGEYRGLEERLLFDTLLDHGYIEEVRDV